jgi:hypothetical protein
MSEPFDPDTAHLPFLLRFRQQGPEPILVPDDYDPIRQRNRPGVDVPVALTTRSTSRPTSRSTTRHTSRSTSRSTYRFNSSDHESDIDSDSDFDSAYDSDFDTTSD